jgi:hypothetical protein
MSTRIEIIEEKKLVGKKLIMRFIKIIQNKL